MSLSALWRQNLMNIRQSKHLFLAGGRICHAIHPGQQCEPAYTGLSCTIVPAPWQPLNKPRTSLAKIDHTAVATSRSVHDQVFVRSLDFMKSLLAFVGLLFVLPGHSSLVAGDLTEDRCTALIAELQPGKDALWRTIPWKLSVLDARAAAFKQDKPIFIWAMDGHPLGCT